jgi:hypothetical protein
MSSMAMEWGAAGNTIARKVWRAQRSPIPIRARDVRERRHGFSISAPPGGVVEQEFPCGNACQAPSRSSADAEAKTSSSQCVANQPVTKAGRRHDSRECSEERERLGFGETPFKQMPEISSPESARRQAALENSLHDGFAQQYLLGLRGTQHDSRFPLEIVKHELGLDEDSLAPKVDLASHVSEGRRPAQLSKQGAHNRSSKQLSALTVYNAAQPVKPRASIHSRVSPKRCSQTVRRSSPAGRSHAACGGA